MDGQRKEGTVNITAVFKCSERGRAVDMILQQ
jgi:hypothetical protein